jgi:hypothetical protein
VLPRLLAHGAAWHLTCTSVAARHWQVASNLPGPAAPYSGASVGGVQWARVRGDASKEGAGAQGASASQPERLGGALRPSSSTTATCRSATCHRCHSLSPSRDPRRDAAKCGRSRLWILLGKSESSRQRHCPPVTRSRRYYEYTESDFEDFGFFRGEIMQKA